MKWRPCKVEGCLRNGVKWHGLCAAHYNRWRQRGDIGAGVPLLMLNNKRAAGALAQILSGVRKAGG